MVVPEMDLGQILQSLASLGAKSLYTAILLAIVFLCASELYRLWFDRSPVLATFEFVDADGSLKTESGKSFTNRLVQQEHRLIGMLRRQSSDQSIVTEEATIQFQDLRIADLNTSELDEIKIEAQGFNLTDLLSKLRNWFLQPNEIRGRIDKVGNGFHVFAEWRSRTVGTGDDGRRFYNRVLEDQDRASFDLAARLIWQNIVDMREPGPLVGSITQNFSPDEFAAFMRAWSDYQLLVPRKDQLTNDDRIALRNAIGVTDDLLGRDKTYPPLYNLAANLTLLEKGPEGMTAGERDRVRELLRRYLAELAALGLGEDDAAKKNLAALEVARPAAARVAEAVGEAAGRASAMGVPATRVALAGASIAPEGIQTAASACCIVRDADGGRYLLTADYIFTRGPGEVVLSPAAVDSTAVNRIGIFARRYLLRPSPVGMALIRLDDNVEGVNEIPELGAFADVAEMPQPGAMVQLFGRSSTLRTGKVLDDRPAGMAGLVATERISEAGDGGAPVLDEQGRLVGMAYAASKEVSGVLPLAPIFSELQLTLVHDPNNGG
jgi:hypothetical protein